MSRKLAGLCAAAIVLCVASGAWGAAPAFKALVPSEARLDNGLRVVVFEDDRAPVARIQLLVPGGVAAQYPTEAGFAHFTAQMLSRGTTTRDAARFARDLADLGAGLTSSARRDFTILDMGVLKADVAPALALLADAVSNPTFSTDEIGRMRFRVSSSIIEMHLNVASTAEEQIWPLAMGTHSYGHTPAGDVPSVVAIDREDLMGFHDRYYKPGGSVLLVAGDVSMETVLDAAQAAFGSWSGTAENVPVIPLTPALSRGGVRIVDLPSRRRTELRLAFTAPERGSLDYKAFVMLNRILGGSPDSRLSATRLPGVFGGARSSYTALRDGGLLVISAPAYSDSVGEAVAALRAVVEGMRKNPPGESEVKDALRVMRNSWPLRMEPLGALVTEWATGDHYGLGNEVLKGFAAEVEAATPGDLVRLAAEWLVWDRVAVLAIGPADAVQQQLEIFGSVEVVELQDAPQAAWASTAPSEEDFRKGRSLADRAVAAHGGAEVLAGVTESSVDATITVDVQGQEAQGRLRQARKDPLQFRELLELFIYGSELVLNGGMGWVYETSSGAVEVADSLQRASMQANFESDVVHLVRLLTEEGTQVAHRGDETVDGRPAELLQVLADGRSRWLLFDAESHLLVGMDIRGGVPPQILARRTFGDYREVGGVMWPYLEERSQGGRKTMRIEAQQIAINPGLSPDTFRTPGPGR